jgi:lysophospholipase L1-like esterase
MRRASARRLLPVALLVLASTLLSLILAELGARLWLERFASDEQFRRFASLAQLRERMEGLGQSPTPYVAHRFIGYVPAPGYRRGRNFHNELGYRGAPIARAKPRGEFRIACLGGSTTYGSHVPDPGLAYPAQLERALHERGHPEVRVVNAGAEGWSSLESLLNFELRVLDLDPDVAIVYHAYNDLFGRMVWPPSAYQGDASGALLHSPGLVPPPWSLRSTLARIFLVGTGRVGSRLALEESLTRIAPTAHFFAFSGQKWKGVYPAGIFRSVPASAMLARNPPIYFRRNLESLVGVARAQGVAVVLATFALCECVQRDPALVSEEVRSGVAEHNRVIEQVGAALGVPVLRFADELPREAELFADAIHLSEAGSRLQGQMVADFLLEQGLVPPAPRSRGP